MLCSMRLVVFRRFFRRCFRTHSIKTSHFLASGFSFVSNSLHACNAGAKGKTDMGSRGSMLCTFKEQQRM